MAAAEGRHQRKQRPERKEHDVAPVDSPMAGRAHRREIRINESGIEQTVVAFDVTLKCRHLSRERALPLRAGALSGSRGISEETPHASGLAAGFFFRQGRRGPTAVASSYRTPPSQPGGAPSGAPP